jgi:hypothetical protein
MGNKLRQVFPRSPFPDVVYRLAVDMWKLLYDSRWFDSLTTKFTDGSHIIRGKRSQVMTFHAMHDICLMGNVFQVIRQVVGSAPINMVDFVSFGARAKKRSRHENMNLTSSSLRVFAQHNLRVTLIQRRFKDTPDSTSLTGSDVFNATSARHQVIPFKTNHVTPFFGFNHSLILAERYAHGQ